MTDTRHTKRGHFDPYKRLEEIELIDNPSTADLIEWLRCRALAIHNVIRGSLADQQLPHHSSVVCRRRLIQAANALEQCHRSETAS